MAYSFAATVGPLLIFVCVAFILFGIFIAQLYYYYTSFKHDNPYLRTYVWAMGALETTHTVLCVVFLYWYLIAHFGDQTNGVNLVHWSLRATVMLEIIMVFMAQALYCWRIMHVSNGKARIVVTGVPAFLVFTRFLLGIISFILWAPLDQWTVMIEHPDVKGTMTATFSVELAADAAISAFLSWCLWRKRQNTMQYTRTNDIIQKLVWGILNTATANIICSAAVIITFNTVGETLTFVAIVEMRSKLYANVMMALLNARNIIFARDIELPALAARKVPTTQVHIYTDTIIQGDSNDRESDAPGDVKSPNISGKSPVLQ